MPQKQLRGVVLTIDTKKYRLRIHKQVYHSMGNPKLFQFLVNPEDGVIAVQGLNKRTPGGYSVKVNLAEPEGHASCDVYCKYLIDKLLSSWNSIQRGYCYTLTGTLLYDQKAAYFPMATLEMITED